MKKRAETTSNEFVRDLLKSKYAIDLEPIPPSKDQGVKTPDFRYGPEESPLLVCEVKTFVDAESWPPADGEIHGRNDTGPSRVGGAIHKAHAQLIPFNAPKVLVLHNTTVWLDAGDLDDAFLGFRRYFDKEGGFSYFDESARKVAMGKICEEKAQIDLFVWIQHTVRENDQPTVCFRTHMHRRTGIDITERHFGVDRKVWKAL
jgi:hypothetical protein